MENLLEQNQSKGRNLSFEILKIICMFLIICHHLLIHGGMYNPSTGYSKVLFDIISALFMFAVNGFVLVSGYFNVTKKTNYKRVLNVVLMAIGYVLAIFLIVKLAGKTDFSWWKGVVRAFQIDFWFIQCYVLLMLVAPFLNMILKNATKKQLQILLLIIVFVSFLRLLLEFALLNETALSVNGGYSFIWFCCLYMFAGYIKLYDVKIKSWILSIVALVSFGVLTLQFSYPQINDVDIFGIHVFEYIIGYGESTAISPIYANFWALTLSLSIFLLFQNKPIWTENKNHPISYVASCTLAIYIIHECRFLSGILYSNILKTREYALSQHSIWYMLLFAVLIFVCCVLIETLRRLCFWGIRKLVEIIKTKHCKKTT